MLPGAIRGRGYRETNFRRIPPAAGACPSDVGWKQHLEYPGWGYDRAVLRWWHDAEQPKDDNSRAVAAGVPVRDQAR